MNYSFRWRNKAFLVFDLDNPILKANIKADNLSEAWTIWFDKHLDQNEMPNLNEISIIQYED